MGNNVPEPEVPAPWFFRIERPTLWFIALAMILLAGLGKEPWYDEAYTILCYIVPGPMFALSHYGVPNNHMLFSVIAGLLPPGPPIQYRTISVLFAVGTLLAVFKTVVALKPRTDRSLVATVVTSLALGLPAFLTLATQIRGYALSMFLTAWGLYLLLAPDRRRRSHSILYAAIMAALLGVIPANGLIWGAFLVGDLVMTLGERNGSALARTLARRLWPHILALAGFALFLPVFPSLLENLTNGWGQAISWSFMARLAAGLSPGCFVIAAACAFGRQNCRWRRFPARAALFFGGFGVAMAAGLFTLRLSGSGFFVRNLSPALPVVMTALVLLLTGCDSRRCVASVVLACGLGGMLLWGGSVGWLLQEYRPELANVPFIPYFESRAFDPFETVGLLGSLDKNTVLIAANGNEKVHDSFALYYAAIRQGYESRFILLSAVQTRGRAACFSGTPVLLVSPLPSDLPMMCRSLGVASGSAHPVKPKGYYKAWLIPRLDSPSQ